MESACLDHDEMCAFVARQVSAEQAAVHDAHVADCADCRKLMFALAEPAQGEVLRLARFEIEGVIGQGAMGTVYRGRDPELDRVVAIKVRRSPLDTAGEERLRTEARALARLTHPNVVAVYEVGSEAGATFVVMEYVDGVTFDKVSEHKLERLVEAGRGLAAAHAVGLIHRDFKPQNIFVAGAAKVGDFGLVRVGSEPRAEGAREPATLTLSSGALVGTPAYMAPEQLRGEIATEASDQFGFCVTLYEAMTGARPFRGARIAELLASIEHGVRVPSALPVRVRRVLERGLAADPARRFPSMTALLATLRPRPARVYWLGAAGAAAIATSIVVATTRPASEPSCSAANAHVAEVWNADRARAIERAFGATHLPYAADAANLVHRSLDSYAAGWAKAHRDACEAGQRGEQSAAALDARMQCLAHRLDEMRALTATFAGADAGVVRRAARAMDTLSPTERCLDLDVVLAQVPAPDPAKRAGVEQARGDLAAPRAALTTGHFAEAATALQALVARARTVGYQPLVAEVLFELGRADVGLEDAPAAQQAFDEAARLAYSVRDDEIAARAWIELAYVAGYLRADAKAGGVAAEMARATLARVPHGEVAWSVQLLSYEGVLAHERGDYKAARDKHRQALALADKLPPGHDGAATVRNNLANTMMALGDGEEAVRLMREAIAIREKTAGAQHPDTATNRGGLAHFLSAIGRHPEAVAEFDRAIAILENSLGPDHPALATALMNSCGSLQALDRTNEALARAQRALAIFEKRLGASHPTTGTAMTQVATMLTATRRPREAVALFTRSLAIQEVSLGPDHPRIVGALDNLGFALIDTGDTKRAIAQFERALAIVEAKLGKDHPRVMYPLLGLGQAYVDSDPARAVGFLRRALVVQEKAGAAPADIAEARRLLARAQAKLGRKSTR